MLKAVASAIHNVSLLCTMQGSAYFLRILTHTILLCVVCSVKGCHIVCYVQHAMVVKILRESLYYHFLASLSAILVVSCQVKIIKGCWFVMSTMVC